MPLTSPPRGLAGHRRRPPGDRPTVVDERDSVLLPKQNVDFVRSGGTGYIMDTRRACSWHRRGSGDRDDLPRNVSLRGGCGCLAFTPAVLLAGGRLFPDGGSSPQHDRVDPLHADFGDPRPAARGRARGVGRARRPRRNARAEHPPALRGVLRGPLSRPAPHGEPPGRPRTTHAADDIINAPPDDVSRSSDRRRPRGRRHI